MLRNRSPELVELYDALEKFVRTLGPVEIVAREHYVLLRTTKIFADLVIMKDAVRCAIHLARRVADPRFVKVAESRRMITHVAKLTTKADLRAMQPFLREAYALSVAPAAVTTIRAATPSDVDEIARLHVKTWQVAYRGHMPDDHLNRLDPSKRAAMWSKAIEQPDTVVLVATAGETLVGFCSLLPSRDPDAAPHVAEIAAIYVDPAVWRAGIGRSLVEAAIAAVLPRDFAELTLWVLTDNADARAFYESCGFRADGHTKIEQRPGFSIHETRYRRRIVASGAC